MTAPISVDPSALASIGTTVGGEGDGISAAIGSLDSGLSGAGAMFGHDAAGVLFAQSYTASGKALLDAAGSAVNACRRVGFGVQMSAANYGRANASSTVGGGTSPVPVPTSPGQFGAPGMPPPFGAGIAAPVGWALVEAFVGDVWPDGNPGELRAAAGSWRSFGTAVSGLAEQVSSTGPGLSAQQIPEAAQMARALGQVGGGLTDIASQAKTLATAVDGFADAVETTQDAVRGLLDQLSLSGVLETIGGIFTGENPLDKVREVAHEIKVVLDNMKREAEATSHVFSQGINMLDSATNSSEKWAKKEFTDALGQDVGGALSLAFTATVDRTEGAVKFVAATVQGVHQLDPTRFAYDPSGALTTWEAMGESAAVMTNPALLASKIIEDPSGSLDTLKDVVDWKDVEAGHPFRAMGYNEAQIATALIPGAGEAEPAIEGAQVAGRVASAEERSAAGATRDVVPGAAGAPSASDTIASQAGRVSSDLNAIKVPESTTPGAAPGASTPAGRPPVDATPPAAGESGGRAPVDAPASPEPPRAEPTSSGSAGSSASEPSRPVPASDSAHPAGPRDVEPAPARADPPPPPSSHGLEPSQIAENDEMLPPIGSDSYEPGPAAAGESSRSMADSGGLGSDVSPASGADDKVPVSVGAQGGESSEGAGGAGHGSVDGSGHVNGDGTGSSNDGDAHPRAGYDDRGGHVDGDHGRHDPVHSDHEKGNGWHRLDDGPDRSEYGQPLPEHWPSAEYPHVDDPNVRDLITDADAPYGRDADGEPFTKEQYDERYNIVDHGRHWENYPPNDGAERGTKVSYDSLDALRNDYGDALDRIGKESGKYLALMTDGMAAPFESRGLPLSTLNESYFGYVLAADGLDSGWTVEISAVAPAFGRDGGSLQVLFKDQAGVVLTVEELKRLGILRKIIGP